MSPAYQALEERRSPRDEVDFHCQAQLKAGQVHVHLVNISPLGCMIRCATIAIPEEPLSLRLPLLGSIGGRVAWAKLDRIGIEFTQPIDGQAYPALLAQLNPHRPGNRYR